MDRKVWVACGLAVGVLGAGAAGVAIAAAAGLAPQSVQVAATAPSPDSQAAEVAPGPASYVRVTEIGHPPLGMSGPSARSIARKNAMTRARESLLRTILSLQTRDGRKVGDILRQKPELKPGLRPVLEGASTAGVELANNAVEITLTVRMDGETGLGRYLDTLQTPSTRSP